MTKSLSLLPRRVSPPSKRPGFFMRLPTVCPCIRHNRRSNPPMTGPGVRRTDTSGVLLIGGRHPGLAINASWDNGMTWKAFRIDTTFWANGQLYEIEPNVMLYISTAKYSDPKVRIHMFRISDERIDPIRVSG